MKPATHLGEEIASSPVRQAMKLVTRITSVRRETVLRLAIIPLFGALALGSASPKKGSGDDTSSTTDTTAASIGKAVLVGDAEYTVIDIANRGTVMKANNEFEKDATTTGNYIQVHFKVLNKGKKEGFLTTPKLVDGTSREFGTMENSYAYRPKGTEGIALEKVQPSMSREFTEIYELPAGVTTASMKAIDFDLFGKDKLINLGALPPAPPPPPPVVAAAPKAGAPAVKAAAAPAAAAKAKAAPAKKP